MNTCKGPRGLGNTRRWSGWGRDASTQGSVRSGEVLVDLINFGGVPSRDIANYNADRGMVMDADASRNEYTALGYASRARPMNLVELEGQRPGRCSWCWVKSLRGGVQKMAV